MSNNDNDDEDQGNQSYEEQEINHYIVDNDEEDSIDNDESEQEEEKLINSNREMKAIQTITISDKKSISSLQYKDDFNQKPTYPIQGNDYQPTSTFSLQINDPSVSKLLNLDIESTDKESIINILLKSRALELKNLPSTSTANQMVREKAKLFFCNTTSQIKSKEELLKYSKTDKYHIYQDDINNNPQFTFDFDIATQQIINKLRKEQWDSETIRVLLSGLPDYSHLSRNQLDQKIRSALNRIQEDIERIGSGNSQDFYGNHTFAPRLISQQIGKRNEKRKLNQFIEDQHNHQMRVNDKIEKLKNEVKESNKNSNCSMIDKNSEEIFKSVVHTDGPVYDRLYNQHYQTSKTTLLKNKNKSKIKEKKREKINTQEKITLDKEANLLSKYNKNKQKDNNTGKKPKKPLIKSDELRNNEFLLSNFLTHYDQVVSKYKQKQSSAHNYSNNPYKKVKLSFEQIQEFLSSLGMCSLTKREKDTSSLNITQRNESAIQAKERILIEEIWNTLRDSDLEVNIDHLKEFLISVVNLQPYNLYKDYTKHHTQDDINKLLSLEEEKNKEKCKKSNDVKESKIDIIIKAKNKELKEKTDNSKPSKYISYDNEGNVLIPINKSNLIRRDFDLFYIIYMANRPRPKYTKEKEIQEPLRFNPTINKISKNMAKSLKSKIILPDPNIQTNEDTSNKGNQIKDKNTNKIYLTQQMLDQRKEIAENLKRKEENSKKEMAECTFKPKTNNKSILKGIQSNRYYELYHKGSEKEKYREDRNKEEIELDTMGELTFKPNNYRIEANQIVKTKFKNDIYNEHNYQMYYERLKNGRINNLMKQAATERFAIDDLFKQFNEQYKQNKPREQYSESIHVTEDQNSNNISRDKVQNTNQERRLQNKIYRINKDNILEDNNEMNINNRDNINYKENRNNVEIDNNNTDYNNNVTGSQSPEINDNEEKKESTPLLIIDVNIGQGVKKKIYVYEPDTPTKLADKFAAENCLEPQTKEKLKNLIHNHMSKLLTRIDEENLEQIKILNHVN